VPPRVIHNLSEAHEEATCRGLRVGEGVGTTSCDSLAAEIGFRAGPWSCKDRQFRRY
jgi:hypothetical protein